MSTTPSTKASSSSRASSKKPKGPPPIKPEDLRVHNREDDAWMCLEGKVYDVTNYIKFHPGGKKNLLRGVGLEDAIELFNQVHPYVNYGKILGGKQIGIIQPSTQPKRGAPGAVTKGERRLSASQFLAKVIKTPKTVALLPRTRFTQTEYELIFEVGFKDTKEVLSKENWTVGVLGRILVIKFILNSVRMWLLHLELERDVVNESPSIAFMKNYHRIKLTLRKKEPITKWKALGKPLWHNNQILKSSISAPEDRHFASISYKVQLTHNVILFGIKPENAQIGTPPGFDVKIWLDDNSRYYTPVTLDLLKSLSHLNSGPDSSKIIHLIIKIYPMGALTPRLDRLSPKTPRSLQIGQVNGMFSTKFLDGAKTVLILTGGAGITPFISIIKHIQSLKVPPKVILTYFNRTEKDIILKADWETLARENPWFKFVPVLTSSGSLWGGLVKTWRGLRGHPTPEMITDILGTPEGIKDFSTYKSTKFLICGPEGFVDSGVEILTSKLRFPEDCLFVFSS